MHEPRPFDRVLIIVFENQYRNYVMQNPFFRKLAGRGIFMKNYFGVMHPSQTNYLPMIAGENCGVAFDAPIPAPANRPELPLEQETIVDLLEASGLRWKAYMQGYVRTKWSSDLTPLDYPLPFPVPLQEWPRIIQASFQDFPQPLYPYAFWHNAFSMFKKVIGDQARWNNLEDESGFWRDLLRGDFPEYAIFCPNLWNGGHYTVGTGEEPLERAPLLVNQAAEWLEAFFEQLNFPGPDSLLPPRTMVVVTYDEADYTKSHKDVAKLDNSYDGPNQIYTVLLGDTIEPRRVGAEALNQGYNHYSLLRTVQKNFGLGDLGKNDADSNWFQFLWGREFRWGAPEETPFSSEGGLASAGLGGVLHVVYGSDGGLRHRKHEGGRWSKAEHVPASGSAFELVSFANQLMLFCLTDDGLSTLRYDAAAGWSAPGTVPGTSTDAFAVTAYIDHGDDNTEKVMLAFSGANGMIQSKILSQGEWLATVAVNQSGGGAMELAVLGPSIYLIHHVAADGAMQVISFNTAGFNVLPASFSFPAGVSNNGELTQYEWSPSQFPVAHFGVGAGRGGNETDPVLQPYESAGPMTAATLDGVIHLAYRSTQDDHLESATFSLSGVMTPKNEVDQTTTSDKTSQGWGTLAEAGWSVSTPIPGVRIDPGGALSMSLFGSKLAMVFQPKGENAQMCVGELIRAHDGRD